MQVLKRKLALLEPNLNTAAFMYEEGGGLDAEEVTENAAHLPTPLAGLPGGGIRHGATFQVTDQAQALELDFVVTHKVRCLVPCLGVETPAGPCRGYTNQPTSDVC